MGQRKNKLSNIVNALNIKVECGENLLENEVEGGYVSDLLSDVMAHSKKGDIWITLQGHPNIVAVAKLKELAGIIIVNKRNPEEETIKKAKDEKIPIMTSNLTAFELVGKLYELGISGMRE
jgi:predicted transcriptional regulator